MIEKIEKEARERGRERKLYSKYMKYEIRISKASMHIQQTNEKLLLSQVFAFQFTFRIRIIIIKIITRHEWKIEKRKNPHGKVFIFARIEWLEKEIAFQMKSLSTIHF